MHSMRFNVDDTIGKFKARLVVKGCTQAYRIHYIETF